jgi:hypothetical protein
MRGWSGTPSTGTERQRPVPARARKEDREMDTKQAERAIIAGLEELGWATKVGLAELDGVHGKVNVALKRLITAGKVVRAKADLG